MALKDLIVRIRGDKQDLDKNLEGAGASLGRFKGKAVAIAAVITGIVAGAFKVLKMVIDSTKTSSDAFERVTSTLKGGLQAFFRTIASGQFGLLTMIQNIKAGAKAAREATIAHQELGEVMASNDIKKAYSERAKNEAMLGFYEETNNEKRREYILEAIREQERISRINLETKDKLLRIEENKFATLLKWGKEYTDKISEYFRMFAGNYEEWFGKGKQLAIMQQRERDILRLQKERGGYLDEVTKKELYNIQVVNRMAEAYYFLHNNQKADVAGSMAAYVKMVKEMIDVQAEASSSLNIMTRKLINLNETIREADLEKLKEMKEAYQGITKITLTATPIDTSKLREMIIQPIGEINAEFQNILNAARDGIIEMSMAAADAIGAVIGGADVKDVGKDLLQGFASMLSQLGRMLVVYAFGIKAFKLSAESLQFGPALAAGLAMIAAAGAIRAAISSAPSAVSGGGGGGYGSEYGAQNMRIVVEGKLRGRDIYISGRRYEELNG